MINEFFVLRNLYNLLLLYVFFWYVYMLDVMLSVFLIILSYILSIVYILN